MAIAHTFQPYQRQIALDALGHGRGIDAMHLERVGDVLCGAQVRKQGESLEHHADGSTVRGEVRHRLAIDKNGAVRGRNEAGDHAQQRRLTAAARPQ